MMMTTKYGIGQTNSLLSERARLYTHSAKDISKMDRSHKCLLPKSSSPSPIILPLLDRYYSGVQDWDPRTQSPHSSALS